MAILTNRQKMGAAAIIMAVSVLLSRFMGLARDKVISWQFGTGGDADIYFAAFVVPDFLNYLLAGGYISITLIPLLSRRFEEDEADGWAFFSTIFTWATLSIGLLTLLAWLVAPALAPLVAPGFDAPKLERLATFLRIVLPAQIFFLPGACLCALLYIRNQFSVPALMPLIYNGCILLFGVGLPWLGLAKGMEGFCWGVLAGAALGAFLLPLLAARAVPLPYRPMFFHKLMPRFLVMALPLMLGQSVVVLDEQFVRIFGSMAGEGAVSLLNYARRIMLVPVGVVAQAAGVASFPFLAALAAKGNKAAFDQSLGTALRNSLIVILPMSAWIFAAAWPILGFIFEGGSFRQDQTALAVPLLRIMLCAVPFWAIQQITGRAFYARQDTVTPAVVGTVATLAAVPFYILLVPRMGASGVAVVTTLSLAVYALVLLGVWAHRQGRESLKGLARVSFISLGLAAPAAAATWLCSNTVPALLPGSLLMGQLAALATGGLGFLLVYFVLGRIFAPTVVAVFLQPFIRRLRRKTTEA